jgi:hypothetical protein
LRAAALPRAGSSPSDLARDVLWEITVPPDIRLQCADPVSLTFSLPPSGGIFTIH